MWEEGFKTLLIKISNSNTMTALAKYTLIAISVVNISLFFFEKFYCFMYNLCFLLPLYIVSFLALMIWGKQNVLLKGYVKKSFAFNFLFFVTVSLIRHLA